MNKNSQHLDVGIVEDIKEILLWDISDKKPIMKIIGNTIEDMGMFMKNNRDHKYYFKKFFVVIDVLKISNRGIFLRTLEKFEHADKLNIFKIEVRYKHQPTEEYTLPEELLSRKRPSYAYAYFNMDNSIVTFTVSDEQGKE